MSRRVTVFRIFSLMLTLLAGPALAQEVMAPSHADLYARIRVAGFPAPVEIRQSGQKTRLDLTAGGVAQTFITDREKGVLISMTGAAKLAMVFPLDRNDGVVPLPLDVSIFTLAGAQLQTVGASLVNGRSCRLMQFTGYLSQSGMICVTPDNVVLRMTAAGRREPLFEIVDLTVASQDAKWFRTPADYQVAVVPAIGGASSGTTAGGTVATAGKGSGDSAPLPKVIYSKPKTQP